MILCHENWGRRERVASMHSYSLDIRSLQKVKNYHLFALFFNTMSVKLHEIRNAWQDDK